jgi:cell division protein FtsB
VRRKKKEERFVLFLLVFFLVFLLFLNFKIFQERKKIKEKADSLRSEIENLIKKKEEIEKSLSESKKETFWEEKAREQGFIKEGEEPIIIQFK